MIINTDITIAAYIKPVTLMIASTNAIAIINTTEIMPSLTMIS